MVHPCEGLETSTRWPTSIATGMVEKFFQCFFFDDRVFSLENKIKLIEFIFPKNLKSFIGLIRFVTINRK